MLGTQVQIKTLIINDRDSETELKTNRKEGIKDHANCKQTLASPLIRHDLFLAFAFFEKPPLPIDNYSTLYLLTKTHPSLTPAPVSTDGFQTLV